MEPVDASKLLKSNEIIYRVHIKMVIKLFQKKKQKKRCDINFGIKILLQNITPNSFYGHKYDYSNTFVVIVHQALTLTKDLKPN